MSARAARFCRSCRSCAPAPTGAAPLRHESKIGPAAPGAWAVFSAGHGTITRCAASFASRRPQRPTASAIPWENEEQQLERGTDILDDLEVVDDFVRAPPEEDEGGPEAATSGAGSLARKMWNCARRNVRSAETWTKLAQRVLVSSALVSPGDVALMFLAFARIKYRDTKVLDALSPFLLKHIEDFSTTELVMLLNAHKKLEYDRLDNMQLLLNGILRRESEWTGRHVALAANAASYFYIYQPRFWRQVAISLHRLVFKMNPLELSISISAMARVDRRDARLLLLMARICRRYSKRNLFSQETLATTMNAFAKLDFNHPKLSKSFETAALLKLDRALAMGPKYRSSSLQGVDVFDVQSLVRMLHTLVCLVGASDEIIEKLLTLISWSEQELSDYQRRALKIVGIVLRKDYRDLSNRLSRDVKASLYIFDHKPVEVPQIESRWVRELMQTLKKMQLEVELKTLVDDQVLDIYLPDGNAVVYAVGPYSFYANSTHRTAYSKLHQRLLEMSGYQCMVVPYYEWSELRIEEDKMVYLWSKGRRAATGVQDEDDEVGDPAPTLVAEALQSDLSDLSDVDAASPAVMR